MDTHTTEIKQIRDARKGTAVNVGKFLSKVSILSIIIFKHINFPFYSQL